ncbi:MAG: C40 family peptidase [Desulfomonile tiedjei]|uniref:C40 family peptidase n=1 Tax=Desulfomonile tiedjei TaxID=2358 RepID=A0A9D6V1R2_9BACT|nr:C40 family peptidase [Desulfomonile tiedjei]
MEKTRLLRLLSCLLLFLLSVQFSAGHEAWGLAENYKRSVREQYLFIISKHPKYTWGGAEDLDKGLDCSGYIFLACKWAGVPGVTRTTSLRMSMGLGGWSGKDIDPKDADECDLLFWTFQPHRPNGHVGAFINDRNSELKITHASTSRGVVLEDLHGVLATNLTKVRRLTIGD